MTPEGYAAHLTHEKLERAIAEHVEENLSLHARCNELEAETRALENHLEDVALLRENLEKAEAELAALRERVNDCPRCGGVVDRG